MTIYVLLTALITLITIVDTIDVETIKMFTTFDWVKLAVKSFIPSLVSLKAFLDTSIDNTIHSLAPVDVDNVNSVSDELPKDS